MLLRHGFHYPKAAWYGAHERTLAQVTFPHPAQDIAYAEYRAAVHEADDRVIHITAALREQVATWRFAPAVNALTALKGIEFIAAATLVTELGDFSRLERPSELMGYLGPVPSEYTSGDSRTHGCHRRDRQHPRCTDPHRVSVELSLSRQDEPRPRRA